MKTNGEEGDIDGRMDGSWDELMSVDDENEGIWSWNWRQDLF